MHSKIGVNKDYRQRAGRWEPHPPAFQEPFFAFFVDLGLALACWAFPTRPLSSATIHLPHSREHHPGLPGPEYSISNPPLTPPCGGASPSPPRSWALHVQATIYPTPGEHLHLLPDLKHSVPNPPFTPPQGACLSPPRFWTLYIKPITCHTFQC